MRGQPPDQRRCERQARAGPLLDAFRRWLDTTVPKLARRSDLAVAIGYALTRWSALTRHIDNSAAERALRGIAIGRKIWLFAGSDQGGHRAATIYSLSETAKLNRVDPEVWLTDTVARIADHSARRVTDLLPWNYRQPDLTPSPDAHPEGSYRCRR